MTSTIRPCTPFGGRPVRRLFRDNGGVAYMEFAIVAPVLVLLLLGIADLGQGFATRFALQQAAARTLEMATLGTGAADYSYLVPEAAAAAGVTTNDVTLDKWLECNGVRKDWAEDCATSEQRARYLQITIESSYQPIFSNVGYSNIRSDGSIEISSDASLRIQ